MSDELAGVRGIVLAGTYHWGRTGFGRAVRGPLLPVGQEPLISYPLRWLRDGGVSHVTVCANSSSNAVRQAFGHGANLSMHLDYYEDHVPRGAAGCVRDAGSPTEAETFVVVEGALIPSFDLRAMLDAHFRSGAAATVTVEIDRRRNRVTSERPRTPGGVYVFDRRVFSVIPPLGFQDIKESLLERLYHAGERVITFEVAGVSPRVMSFEQYSAVNSWLVGRALERSELPEGYVHCGEGAHHVTAVVDPTARIVGPVLIGPRSRLLAGAVVVGPTSIGSRTTIGSEALIARSILWNDCSIGHGAMVDGSLLTDGVVARSGETMVGTIRVRQAPAEEIDQPLLPRTLARPLTSGALVTLPARR